MLSTSAATNCLRVLKELSERRTNSEPGMRRIWLAVAAVSLMWWLNCRLDLHCPSLGRLQAFRARSAEENKVVPVSTPRRRKMGCDPCSLIILAGPIDRERREADLRVHVAGMHQLAPRAPQRGAERRPSQVVARGVWPPPSDKRRQRDRNATAAAAGCCNRARASKSCGATAPSVGMGGGGSRRRGRGAASCGSRPRATSSCGKKGFRPR